MDRSGKTAAGPRPAACWRWPPTGDARPLGPDRPAWPWWLVAALVGLTLTGLRLVLGQGRTVGAGLRAQQTWIVLILAWLVGVMGVRAQEVAPAPPASALQAVHALLALSYPELRASGLELRAVPTPDGVVMEFAERGPAVADLVARTAPRPAQLAATVTLDGAVWRGTGCGRHGRGAASTPAARPDRRPD
ncbi:MAG: hypothetical protein NTV05_08845 [Acidobacteria bacterium]|nr:hypothetical protein [Acidobacteriota bacterium]